MQYQGGKERIAGYIVDVLQAHRAGRPYLEPFLGGASVMARMDGERVGGDIHAGLVAMWAAARDGWVPPVDISEARYAQLKARRDEPDPEVAFAGFAVSFAGRYFEGYARDKRKPAPFAASQSASVCRKARCMQGVQLAAAPYSAWRPTGKLIYCDPPYAGTKPYSRVPRFDSVAFWATMREWARTNTVLVSEYDAPAYCAEVWRKDLAKSIRSHHRAMERLYLVKP